MDFSTVKLHVDFISNIQMQDDTVAGVVIVLISILGNGTSSYLSILTQVCPHTRAVSSSHEYVIGKEVDSGHCAGELARRRFIVVPNVCHNVVKLKDLVAFVGFLETGVKSNLRTVESGAECPCPRSRRAGWTGLAQVTPFPRWTSWARWSGLSGRSPGSGFTSASLVALVPVDEGWRGHDGEILDGFCRRGAGLRAVRVADHSAAAQHLVVG